jgi:Glycosyl hydrolases family 16/Malectin domain
VVLVAAPGLTPDRPAAAPATWRLSSEARPLRDAVGAVWQADRSFASGGRVQRRRDVVENTASPQLYRSRRVGVRGVSVPVRRSATYAVTIHLSETLGARPGTRVFDVLAEGAVVARDVDTAARTAGGQPDQLVFTVPVRDGRLTLRFATRVGEPQYSAIKITTMRRSTAPPAVRWGDEFDGPAGAPPAARRWDHDLGVGADPGWGNRELQTYTDRPENVALTGAGALALTARREPLAWHDGQPRQYTSARIKSQGRFWFQYGELAARIKAPTGQGIWPGFWAVGERVYSIGWPRAGEIDVFEILGSDPTRIWGSVHGPAQAGGPYGVSRRIELPRSAADDFHTYGVLWVPGAIQMRLDGRRYATFTPEDLGPRRRWVFDQPFHVLLNVAVGGHGAGAPDATTPFPQTMLVDWVRMTR